MDQRYFALRSIFFLFLLTAACNKKHVIQYKFNGMVVTRLDYNGRSDFKYGDTTCSTTENGVTAEYYGFNNGMDILMVFKKDSTVELIYYGGGYLKKIGNSKINVPSYSNEKLEFILDEYEADGCGIIRLSNSLELEKRFPDNINSKVAVQY